MEKYSTQKIFAERLKNARLLKGLSAQKVAQSIGISRQAYAKYEHGDALPNSTVLIKLHHVLDISIDYLFRKTYFSLLSFAYRKKSKLGKREQQQLELQIIDKLEQRIELEDLLDIKVATQLEELSASLKPISSEQEIAFLAGALRNQWKLGNDPIANIGALLEQHGIIFLAINAKSDFDGASCKISEYNNRPVVVVNSSMPPERQRFTALHELAHLYLKFEELLPEAIEKLCHVFASEFLLPFSKLGEFKEAGCPIYYKTIEVLQIEYGISFDAIIRRLKSTELISEKSYNHYWINKNKDCALREYAEASRFNEHYPLVYERLVYRALSEGKISLNQAAHYLNVSSFELETQGMAS